MTRLSEEQLQFLSHHDIPLSQVFDATGLKTSQWKEQMKELGMNIAIGVSPCGYAGHTLRVRSGHCVQCKTHHLAFRDRYKKSGEIYVVTSDSLSLTKMGIAGDALKRLQTLRKTGYGGASDWHLRYSVFCETMGRVERVAEQMLKEYRKACFYWKDRNLIDCEETFSCDYNYAIEVIQRAIIIVTQMKKV